MHTQPPPTTTPSYKDVDADRCILYVIERDAGADRTRRCYLPALHEGTCLSWWGLNARSGVKPESEWFLPASLVWDRDVTSEDPWLEPADRTPQYLHEQRRMLAWQEVTDEEGIVSEAQADRIRRQGVYSDPTPAMAAAWDAELSTEMLGDIEYLRDEMESRAYESIGDNEALWFSREAAALDQITARYEDPHEFVLGSIVAGRDAVRIVAMTPPARSISARITDSDGRSAAIGSLACACLPTRDCLVCEGVDA